MGLVPEPPDRREERARWPWPCQRCRSRQPGDDFDFLCVDEFLTNMIGAQALKSALALRLIDQLVHRAGTPRWLGSRRPGAGIAGGCGSLLDLLAANQVVERIGDEIRLTRADSAARLRFRDLLEAKLDFANLAAPDLIQLFPWLLVDPDGFMQKARIFHLFDYNRCLEPSPENMKRPGGGCGSRRCLTRYEAPVCMRFHDFSRHARMLDIGGNSGEFVLRVCKKHPQLRGTIFDLPVVCDVGRDHVAREPEAPRIDFVKGSALVDPLPAGFDLITFKSILHDWSNDDAARMLTRASQFLARRRDDADL